uniref:Transcription factor MYC/MYB N-terminal domain-containing protein n=1 Tax=Aegilops tauschii subsp. strangulata TaxID=200361 RepID=A0A453HMY4_AEGTS
MAVGDALRRLCEDIGWSYAVFWKAIGAADPVHLVWEDGYCGHTPCPAGSEASQARATELGCSAAVDSICSLVRKDMAQQVHVVGEGTIGRVAFTGSHQWIIHGTADDHGLSSEVASEMHYQFIAGIKTIAIIPVLPRGVLQLGSTGVNAN